MAKSKKVAFKLPVKVIAAIKHSVSQIENLKLQYVNEYNSIIEYLKKNGKILPKDYNDFTDWYLIFRHDSVIGEDIPPLEDHDFILYHKYREEELIKKDNKIIGTEEDISDPISKHLHCLSGNWYNKSIMTQDEYKRLIEYAKDTMKNSKLPKNIKPISKGFSSLPTAFYQQTVYRLWKENKKNGPARKVWIDFLHRVFKESYSDVQKTTTERKFASYGGSYESDTGLITFS